MKKDINLFYVYKMDDRKPRDRKTMLAVGFLCLIVLFNAAFMGTFLVMDIVKKRDIAKHIAFFKEPAVAANVMKYEQLDIDIGSAEHDIKLLQAMETFTKAVPEFNTDIYAKIMSVKPENVTILSFSFADETVDISSTTTNNMPPADFTKALETTGIFESVVYRGFSESGENAVMFPITCKLKAGAYE